MHAETNVIKSKGTRFMTCRPDDSERWTVLILYLFWLNDLLVYLFCISCVHLF